MAVTDRSFNPTGNENVDCIKEKTLEMEQVIRECTPEGRRRSIALNYLEACSMFAVKANFASDDER